MLSRAPLDAIMPCQAARFSGLLARQADYLGYAPRLSYTARSYFSDRESECMGLILCFLYPLPPA